jgi:hypothetical protein
VTKLTGPGGNSTALVGTPQQVADALMAYRRVGVDAVLIRGFDPLGDVVDWGAELVPLLREQAERTPVGLAAAGTATGRARPEPPGLRRERPDGGYAGCLGPDSVTRLWPVSLGAR